MDILIKRTMMHHIGHMGRNFKMKKQLKSVPWKGIIRAIGLALGLYENRLKHH